MTTQWNKYPETQPEHAQDVLAFDGCEIRMAYLAIDEWANKLEWRIQTDEYWESFPGVTHWMPLPEFPK